jgi:hypothetical protein|tara:strand:+ start:882 stop:1100 length:219 start_codon:yes stop_codon:yes gene_type:complete
MATYLEILEAYKKNLEGERDTVNVTLDILLTNPTVISEHTNLITELDKLVNQMAEITDKIKIVNFLIQSRSN